MTDVEWKREIARADRMERDADFVDALLEVGRCLPRTLTPWELVLWEAGVTPTPPRHPQGEYR